MSYYYVPEVIKRPVNTSNLEIDSKVLEISSGLGTSVAGGPLNIVPATGTGTAPNTVMGTLNIPSVDIVNIGSNTTELQELSFSGLTKTTVSNNNWTSITRSNNLFCAVRTSGCMTSTDGITWITRTIASRTWVSVIFADSYFITVASNGSTPNISTSPNGITWTTGYTGVTSAHSAIAWSPSLNLLCVVSSSGTSRIVISKDTITWTAITGVDTNEWASITWSPDLSIFCSLGTTLVITSPNGLNWNTYSTVSSSTWSSIVWSPYLKSFIGTSSSGLVMSSSYGTSWVSRNPGAGITAIRNITWSSELRTLLATGDKFLVSTDSISWTTIAQETGSYINAWTTNYFVAISTGSLVYSRTNLDARLNDSIKFGNIVSSNILMNSTNTNILSDDVLIYNSTINDPINALDTNLSGSNFAGSSSSLSINEVSNFDSIFFTSLSTVTLPTGTPRSICWSPELQIYCILTGVTGVVPRYSSDGLTWSSAITYDTRLQVTDVGRPAVCWSPELMLFCAVSKEPTSSTLGYGLFVTSRDAITWITRPATTVGNWQSVCWSPALMMFVAVGNSGLPFNYSYNGILWFSAAAPAVNFTSVCWSSDLLMFLAVQSSSGYALRSYDGLLWTTSTITQKTYRNVIWNDYYNKFYAVSDDTTNSVISYSSDGISWVSVAMSSGPMYESAYSKNVMVFARPNDTFLYTIDGTSFTTIVYTGSTSSAVCWNPMDKLFGYASTTTFIMTNNNNTNRNLTIGSNLTDLNIKSNLTIDSNETYIGSVNSIVNMDSIQANNLNVNNNNFIETLSTKLNYNNELIPVNVNDVFNASWTTISTTSNLHLNGICWSPELQLFVTVAGTGLGSGGVLTSSDGLTWISRICPVTTNDWYRVTWSSELYLFAAIAATGVTNNIMTSPDGITWTSRAKSGTQVLRGLCWSPELLLFVASGAAIMIRSSNGITWTDSSTETGNWRAVCWSPDLNLFCAVKNGGTERAMTSSNGITWTLRTMASNTDWRGIIWSPGLGLFCAASFDGTFRFNISSNGINWTTSVGPLIPYRNIMWSSETRLFTALGNSTNIAVSPDGINWTTVEVTAGDKEDIAYSPMLQMYSLVFDAIVANSNLKPQRVLRTTDIGSSFSTTAVINGYNTNILGHTINIGSDYTSIYFNGKPLNYPYILLINTVAQSIPNITATTVAFNRVYYSESSTTVPYWNNDNRITNRSNFTQMFLCIASIHFGNVANTTFEVYLKKNSTDIYGYASIPTVTATRRHFSSTATILMAPNDFIEVFAYQNSGAPRDIGFTNNTAVSNYLYIYQLPWF